MKLRKIGALGVALVIFAALIGFFVPNANAATTPPWELPSGDTSALGNLTFYNSTGGVVSSGNDLTNMFAYAEASNNQFQGSDVISQGFTKAQLAYAWPDHTKSTALWFADAPYSSTSFPNSNAPAPLKTSTNPVATSTTNGSSNFGGIENAATYDTTTGYANIIQVRMYITGLGGITTSPNYWETDIQVNLAGNSWTQVYPAPVAGPTPTTTTLGALPVSPQNVGTSVTFTATVTPTAAGTVQFFDNGATLNTPQTVAAGKATLTTSTLTAGTHPITATFTPSNPTAFSGSTTASALNYTLNTPAASTITTLTGNPTSVTVGSTTTLTATIAPPTATGTVQFKDGSTNLGTPVTVTSGQAVSAVQTFTVGPHSLSAVYTPDSGAFLTSTGTLTYTVNPLPATTTTTAMTVTQSSPQAFGTNLSFNATVTPTNAVGSVHFFDGTHDVAHATVSGGTASVNYAGLSAGSHTLKAEFQPTDSNLFGLSDSPTQSYSITPAASTVSLGALPASSASFGQAVTITATVGPVGVGTGTVQFRSLPGDVAIGGPVSVSGTTAQITTPSPLPVSTTGLEAIFTPDSVDYTASPNSSIAYTITPANTAVALSVSPSGGHAVDGTTETLTAAITPASASGTVQFFDGGSMIGSAVTVAAGSASLQQTLADGPHTLTAMFITSDSSSFNSSPTSNSVLFNVIPPPTATTTTVAVTPGTTEPYGTDLTFTATVSPTAAGTVTFKDGSTVLGTGPVASGTATFSTVGLSGGAHSVTAAFVPTDPTAFAGSTSDATSVTVTAVDTTTSLAVNTAGPVEKGHSVTLTATVNPSNAMGSVTFFNGATSLGTGAVSAGVATLVTTKIAVGDAMLTATFNATHSADFVTSASDAVSLTVVAPPSISTVYDNGKLITSGAHVTPGATIQIHASGFQAGETVKVYLHSTPTLVDTVKASATGDVIVNVVIPAGTPLGTHTIELVGSLGSVSFPITVVAANSGGGNNGGGLANTGVDVRIGLVTGMLLLIGGLVLIGAARRRGVRG